MDMHLLQTIIEIALPLFLIMDPIGNSALCLVVLADLTPKEQRRVIFRELLFALGVIILFHYVGEGLLGMLDIRSSTLRISGGLILFVIAMRMVFPREDTSLMSQDRDPFFVPIAVPLIAGPSLLAAVMLYSHREESQGVVLGAIGIAWLLSVLVMMVSPSLKKVLGVRGLRAAERLMGLILIFLSVQMLEEGVRLFMASMSG